MGGPNGSETTAPGSAAKTASVPSPLLLVLIITGYVAVGLLWSWRAPGGRWTNRVFDVDMLQENDPGGFYIPAAHELFSSRGRTCYAGHPGTPLVLLLHAEQQTLYAFGRMRGSLLAFTPFVATHFEAVWLAAKLGMVLCHLASFLVLYEYARLLTRERRLALWSVAIYATSFPVLFYLDRVSVEPLMVGFFLGTVVCLIRAEEGPGDRWRPQAWAAAAGFCAVSAFFTKIHLMAFWPAISGVALLLGLGGPPLHSRRQRASSFAAYALAVVLAGSAYAWLVDWSEFVRYWQFYGRIEGGTALSAAGFIAHATRSALVAVPAFVRQIHFSSLLPSLTRQGCFFLFEGAAVLVVLIGIAVSRKRGELRRRLLGWMLAYSGVVVAVWFYRSGGWDFSGFHYLFPVIAALAPLAAIGITSRGLATQAPPRLWAAILVLHGLGMVAVGDSMRQDAVSYRRSPAPYYQMALTRARPDDRIGVVGLDVTQFFAPYGLTDRDAGPGRRSALVRELDSRFVRKPSELAMKAFDESLEGLHVRWVLDFQLADPGPWSVAEWVARRGAIIGVPGR